ncbi:MAG TPA: hypothetical protein VFD01_00450 [Candidatus Dormibacteraeota bacterium]|nr:hypothetical protein [Candidatus Dormibacteraeota bacterium]
MSSASELPWALVARAGEIEVEERSRLAAQVEQMTAFHHRWLVLSTCHRVELYGFGPRPDRPEMRLLEGEDAVRHLFRVAAGLESAVPGEDEVLGQVRRATSEGRARRIDERLARLFESAVATGRAARARGLRPQLGLAQRAVAWLEGRARRSGGRLLVAGTGVMGSALARAALAGGWRVTVAGHGPGRAELSLADAARLAPEVDGIAIGLRGEWSELAALADPRCLPPVADLSAPSAVPRAVREALGEDFLGIDGLWEMGARGGSADPDLASWIAAAEAAVEEGVGEYLGWLRGRRSVDTLVALKARGEERRRSRVERLFRRLPHLGPRERELVEVMTRQLVTDLLHEPVCALRSDPDGSQREAARRLFGL